MNISRAAMEFPIYFVIANIFMEHFKKEISPQTSKNRKSGSVT